MGTSAHLRLLKVVLWKNYLLLRKQWPWVVTEILVPISLFALTSYGRANYSNVNQNVSVSQSVPMKTITSYLTASDNWELWYAASAEHHVRIIDQVIEELKLDKRRVFNFDSSEELFEEFNNYTGNDYVVYSVAFEPHINIYNNLSYNISMGMPYVDWNTGNLYRSEETSNEYNYNPYLHEGFLALQILINKAFIERTLEYNQALNITISVQEIPEYESDANNDHGFYINILLPLSMIFTLCLPIFLSVWKQMPSDQNSGMNDLMTVSGVPMVIILLGWFIQRSIMILLTLVPIIFFLKGNFWGTSYSPIMYCHWSILFLFMLFYTMTAITADLFMDSAFKNSSAYYFIMVFWMMSYFLPTAIFEYTNELFSSSTSYIWIKMIASLLFPNTALHLGLNTLEGHESAEIELNFSNIFSSRISNKGLPMGYLLPILLLNIILTFAWLIIIFDVHNKITRKSSNFNKRENADEHMSRQMLLQDCHPFVTIKNLRKKIGLHTTLEIPELDLRQGEITAVLGTNGSGKTTLMSIIAGITKSYSGTVSVVNKTDEKDPQIGYCPQTNVLFEGLTVEENVQFFAKLRNGTVADTVPEVLKEMKLSEQKTVPVRNLSTGSRRKLSLAIALVGNPEIILLDEPTDCVVDEFLPDIREVLGKCSKSTIFITTGHSREAELIADNVVFLNKGRIFSPDSSLTELRRNDGYYISLVFSETSEIRETETYVRDNSQELTILQRVGKNMIIHCIDERDKCLAHIRLFEVFKTNWKIETISCNLYVLDNLFMKHLNSQDLTASLKKFRERDLPQLSELFEQLSYGFKKSILMKKLFLFRKKLHWFIPGLLMMLLFASASTIWSFEGRHHFANNQSAKDFSMHFYDNNGVFFSGINEPFIVDSIMEPYGRVNAHTVEADVCTAIAGRLKNGTLKLGDTNIAAVDFILSDRRNLAMNIVYSPRALHSAPIAVNLAMNTLLKITKPNSSFSITTNNVPFKQYDADYIMNELSNAKVFVLWSILLPLGMLFLLADYLTFPNIEFNTRFLQLRAISLKRVFWYWNLQIVCDIGLVALQIAILVGCILILEYAFTSDVILNYNDLLILFVILLTYAVIQTPSCYVFGSLRRLEQGYKNFLLFGIVSGTVPLIAYISMLPETGSLSFVAYPISMFFPQFALVYNLYKFGRKFTENYNWDQMNPLVKQFVCQKDSTIPCCLVDSAECFSYRSYFRNEEFGIGNSLFLSIITFIMWQCLLLVFISTPRFQARRIPYNDRKPEKRTIKMLPNESAGKQGLHELVFEDGYFPSLNKHLNCQFHSNRLYGVYGSNGSGKSLLLDTITKENLSFEGEVYRTGWAQEKVYIEDKKYIRDIGFCPQSFDLLNWLTGHELLTLAGLSRGYNIYRSSTAATKLLGIFDLQLLSNRKCAEYSGGKRRILHICHAFVGFPNFIIINDMARSLDIPITKTLYDFLLGFKEYPKKSVIVGLARTERFTTLCDCYLLMDGEELDPHQTQRKSKSFKITFRMKTLPKEMSRQEFEKKLQLCGDACKLIFETKTLWMDIRSRFLFVEVHSTTCKLSVLFEKAEDLKTKHDCIEHVSIAETA